MSQRQVYLVLICALVMIALGFGVQMLSRTGAEPGTTTASGTPKIGGPFELVDTHGKVVRDSDYRGRYLLVFFGYTHCPDVCPTTMLNLSAALEELGPAADKIQPVFITVDPLRDTYEVLADYLTNFDKRFIGLTGSRQQIEAVERSYGVYANAAAVESKSNDYLVDHSAYTYLMGPDGIFRAVVSASASADEAAAKIRKNL